MPEGTASPRRRAERSDSVANREKLLATAEEYFGAHGIDASLHELVRIAGVGIGTLYRHFPSHELLIRALYDRLYERLEGVYQAMLQELSAWDALLLFFDRSVEVYLATPSAIAVMERMGRIDPGYRPGARWEQPMADFVARAQADGDLRADITGIDIAAIPSLLLSVTRFPEPMRSIVRARALAIVVDGLRPEGVPRPPLPLRPLEVDEYHEAVHTEG